MNRKDLHKLINEFMDIYLPTKTKSGRQILTRALVALIVEEIDIDPDYEDVQLVFEEIKKCFDTVLSEITYIKEFKPLNQ